jgi:hypothetical protein
VTRLEVKTEPSGASVELDDRPLGETPLVDDVPADGQRHLVRIRKPRYADVTEPIVLADGKTVEIGRTLEPTVRYGMIDLSVDPWADVYFEGRKVGQAPVQGLRLPVGTHKLRLLNPPMGKSLEYTVEVVQGTRHKYKVKLE